MCRRIFVYFKLYTCIRLGLVIFTLLLLILLKHNFNEDHQVYTALNGINGTQDYNILSEGQWKNVSGLLDYKFLVFSAFLDVRQKREVRIIAVTKYRKPKSLKVWCRFYYKLPDTDNLRTWLVTAQMTIIQENWQMLYSPYYITCPLDKTAPTPQSVSVIIDQEQQPENNLRIIVNYMEENLGPWNPQQEPHQVTKLAVCVKPLHYDYNKVVELLEFLELHRIMGVHHFFLYNHAVGPQVGCLLEKYQQEGLVTLLDWQLPIVSQKEIRTEGIFASLNDCLYRTMHRFSHTIFIDFDEYIMPTQHRTYPELFQYLDKQYGIKNKASFLFKNAFFYRQWPDDPEIETFDNPLAKNLIVLKKTTRKTDLHPHRTRSKMIVRPDLVEMVGNHFIWSYFNKKTFVNMDVKPQDAFMHHYRVCEFGGDDCVTQKSIVDKNAYKYKTELIEAVNARYTRYKSECKLDEFD